jgi:hypothetical protein
VRISFAWLALLLVLLSVAAPVVEAFEDCRVECGPGGEGECGTDQCCSCCPVERFVMTGDHRSPQSLAATAERLGGPLAVVCDHEPRGILHVPKPHTF